MIPLAVVYFLLAFITSARELSFQLQTRSLEGWETGMLRMMLEGTLFVGLIKSLQNGTLHI